MNSKRKLWTNIGSLALVAVLAVGGVIGVLSALNVQISSTFSISYTAHNVHAIITGDYADSTGTQVGNLVNKADQTTQIVFSGEEDNGATKGFADKNDLEIKGPNDTVDIHYIVRNTGSDPFGLTMNFNSNLEQSNMQVRYSVQYWNGQDPEPEYVYNQQTLSEMYLTAAGTDNCCAVVGMQFSVVNQVQNAALNATMNFDLDSTAEAPEPGPLLESWSEARGKVFEFNSIDIGSMPPMFYDYYRDYNQDTKSITFDRYTSDGVYNIDGKNVIEGIEPIDVQDGKIFAYKVPADNEYDVYFLSKAEMKFSDETFKGVDESGIEYYGFASIGFNDFSYGEGTLGYYFDNMELLSFISVDTTEMTDLSNFFEVASADGGRVSCDDYHIKTLDLSGFDTENVTNMHYMFGDCSELTTIHFGENWNTSSVLDMSNMFGASASTLTSLDLTGWDTSKVTNMSHLFEGFNFLPLNWENLDTSSVTDMSYMFSTCRNIESLDLSSLDTSSVTDMSYMFSTCRNIESLDLSSLDTSSVTNMEGMFSNCSLTTLDLSDFDTKSVTRMYRMFYGSDLTTITGIENINISSLVNMTGIFEGCHFLITLDLSGWNTSSVTSMYDMFADCDSLTTIYVGDGWDTSSVTNSNYMFMRCDRLVGGAGTSYSAMHEKDPNDYNSLKYACVDEGPDSAHPGYLTHIRDKKD